jgi:abortive infection bacteriophage resistance protein
MLLFFFRNLMNGNWPVWKIVSNPTLDETVHYYTTLKTNASQRKSCIKLYLLNH